MNAIVEVATAKVVTEAKSVIVFSMTALPEVMCPVRVATSALRVLSQGNHSISAVAPDLNFRNGDVAEAA